MFVALGSKCSISKESDSAEEARREKINTNSRMRRMVFGGWDGVFEQWKAIVAKCARNEFASSSSSYSVAVATLVQQS